MGGELASIDYDAATREAGPNQQTWLVWQLVDASFPTGGFAHSAGLEVAWRSGLIQSDCNLRSFLSRSLHQWAALTLPFMNAVHGEAHAFARYDDWLDAMLVNAVANRASRRQGTALLSSSTAIFATPRMQQVNADKAAGSPCHFGPAMGLVGYELGIDRETVGAMMLFMSLRDGIGAAVRLGVVGSRQGQHLQAELADEAQRNLARFGDVWPTDAAQPTPLLELMQANHDRLSVRLFQS
jgi:urease accessory protein